MKAVFRCLRDDTLLPLKRLTVIIARERCETCFVVEVGSIFATMDSGTFFKKILTRQDDLHALRRHQDASIQVVFYVRRAVNRTLIPPCTAVFRKTNPAHHSGVFKKTLQNNKPPYEPKEQYANHGSIFTSESMSPKKTLERAKRFELSTSTLGRWRSTV